MNKADVQKLISKAADICNESGGRLTEKRQRILELLLHSDTPLSAYEVADRYNKTADRSIPVMSVYRILDFLESEQLVHKLSSANKYVACAHIACTHSHEVPQFLICRSCESVKEIGIKKSIVDELSAHVRTAGYTLMNSQLELDCLCEKCVGSNV